MIFLKGRLFSNKLIKGLFIIAVLFLALSRLPSATFAAELIAGVDYSDAPRIDGVDYYNEHWYVDDDLAARGLVASYNTDYTTLTVSTFNNSSSIDFPLSDDRDGAIGTYIVDPGTLPGDLPSTLQQCLGDTFINYLDNPDSYNIKAQQPRASSPDSLDGAQNLPGGRYVLFECVGLNGNGPAGDLYITTSNGESIDQDPGGSVGNPGEDWAWVDYSGNSYSAEPGNSVFPAADRFRFMSPFEIIDRNTEYPGTDKNVVYAAVRGEAFDNDGSLRLIEDGIIFYWPLKEEAILDGSYSESDYDWQLPDDGVCRSGFVVRTKSSNSGGQGNYGKIRKVLTRTISNSTNRFGGDCVAVHPTGINGGVVEYDEISIVSRQLYGFFKEDAISSSPDIDFSTGCDDCPGTLLTSRFYNSTHNARLFYAQFYWDIEGTGDAAQSVIKTYRSAGAVTLRPYRGDPSDPNSYDRLLNTLITEAPYHQHLGRLDSIDLQDDNTVIYTSDECIADGLKAFLLLRRNPDASGLDDSTMTTDAINHTQALIYNLDGANYVTGWDRGDMNCLGVENIESNAAEILFDWWRGYSSGESLPDVNDDPKGGDAHTAFIAYPSRSTLGDNDPQSAIGNPDEDPISDGGALLDPTCETNGGSVLNWLGCALLATADKIISWIDGALFGLLAVTQNDYSPGGSDSGFRQSWAIIRNIATVSIVATALFMVIATALDFGMFSNYTVKKYMPRLVIAVIALQLSWVLATGFIELVNAIAGGLEAILYYPFSGARKLDMVEIFARSSEAEVSSGLLFSAGLGAGAVALASMGLFGVLSIAYTIVLALITAFVVLVFRKMAIILLLVLTPLAIAAWVLPGNDDLWKKWRTTFVALLLVHPLLVLAIATGKIFASIAVDADGGAAGNVTAWLIGVVAYVGGYFAIPFLIKASFGTLSNITGIVNDKSKGILDRGKNTLNTKRDNQKQWGKDRKLEEARIRQAEGTGGRLRRTIDRGTTGTLGAGMGKRRAAKTQMVKDMEQGYRDRAQRELYDTGLAADQARAETDRSQERAELKLAETQAANQTFNAGAERANLIKKVRKQNAENQKSGMASLSQDQLVAAGAAASDLNDGTLDAVIQSLGEQRAYGKLAELQQQLASQGKHDMWNDAKNNNFGDLKDVSASLPVDLAAGDTAATIASKRAERFHKLSNEDKAKEGKDAWAEYLAAPAYATATTSSSGATVPSARDLLDNLKVDPEVQKFIKQDVKDL